MAIVDSTERRSSKPRKKGLATFETALCETKFGKFNYILIFLSGVILANVLLETLGISFVLPVAQCDLKLTTQKKGILHSIGFAGIITSSHLWGFLADTKGRRKVILPTLVSGFIASFLSSFSNEFWSMVIFRYINGFFVSGGSATIYAYLGEFHTAKTRSRAIMGASVIFGMGAMVLPLLAMAILNYEWSFHIDLLGIDYKPWRLLIVVLGLPGLLSALCLYQLPESPKFVLSIGKEEESLNILKNIFAINTGKDKDEFSIITIAPDLESTIQRQNIPNLKSNPLTFVCKSMWNQTVPLFSKEFVRKTILACTIQFSIFFTSNGMYMWFPFILNTMMEYSKNHPGQSVKMCDVVHEKLLKLPIGETLEDDSELTCSGKLEIDTFLHSLTLEVMYSVGFAIIGFIINTIGKLPILFFIMTGCGLCGIASIYVTTPIIAVYLYIVLLVCGLAIAVVNAATVDLYPTHLRAMAICISLMFGRLGSAVGANVVGSILDYSCEGTFYVSGLTLILGGFLGFLIPKPPENMELRSRESSLVSMTGNSPP
ncbi:synaptic vesicle glycoprotein 2A-like [Condylostylus longicornis]|uniref:synaptic vesicle glycoprotein 2A-like n=1 Tax=Condylostylus longicornis TaxID=2530218 RepID=UPI00244DB72E|nr:synaptic vesicle glycoprotein 2A-like [Condylostylus longicornis]